VKQTAAPRAPRWPAHLYLIGDPQRPVPVRADARQMGNKAYNLARMAHLGLNVPEALVLGTAHAQHPHKALPDLMQHGLPALEALVGKRLGDPRNPLLLSVRSGAAVSMPGMMETILNIGLCDDTVSGLIRQTGHPRMVWDSYRRLVACYGEVVKGIPADAFDAILPELGRGSDERQLDFADLRELTRRHLQIYEAACGQRFPQSPIDQLRESVLAIFASWNAEKARTYRELNHIDHHMGTAVTIQRMVFGNSGLHSGSGVGFTRNPTTGAHALWVDFLPNAQGEDVVAGRRAVLGADALAQWMPDVWRQLQDETQLLENAMGDMQDFEFTVESGTLYFLQTRHGKRTTKAAARIALDLLDEQVIDAPTARARLKGMRAEALQDLRLADVSDPAQAPTPAARAVPACPGVASGKLVLDPARAVELAKSGQPVILVRKDAETSDVAAFQAARGLLTQRGARTSHAAVVARQLDKVCLVACEGLAVDEVEASIRLGDVVLPEGSVLTLDGHTGCVYIGEIQTVGAPDVELQARWRQLMGTR
jgi:pyruvate,orthophosphate dikinase